jgi:cobalamin biosynthesis Mg chelatase CobN
VLHRISLFVLACALSLAFTATASANLLDVIVADYADDGRLNACKYTQKQLQTLKALIPNDLAAYDAGFSPAVDDALARRAEGACNKQKAQNGAGTGSTVAPAGGATPPPPAASGATSHANRAGAASSAAPSAPATVQPPPTPTAQPQPAPAVIAGDPISVAATATDPATDAPFPVLALAILAGLFALAGLVVALVRWRGWEPAWAVELRHAAGEAGWRASSTWAEFTDFVRFGR